MARATLKSGLPLAIGKVEVNFFFVIACGIVPGFSKFTGNYLVLIWRVTGQCWLMADLYKVTARIYVNSSNR